MYKGDEKFLCHQLRHRLTGNEQSSYKCIKSRCCPAIISFQDDHVAYKNTHKKNPNRDSCRLNFWCFRKIFSFTGIISAAANWQFTRIFFFIIYIFFASLCCFVAASDGLQMDTRRQRQAKNNIEKRFCKQIYSFLMDDG